MDGETYERWVAGIRRRDRDSPKGRLRTDDKGVRFVEVTVNGPKTWSLAAALHPEIAEAYDAAQMAAAEEIIGWLAEHATTRVGPRGRQVQVPVEQIEAAVVRHFTSRAGDPHRHLHLQINARVFAAGAWRGLHTVGVRDSLEAINGIGHAAVMTDPEFRAALAAHGYTLDAETGEVVELAPYAGAFSARARQIETNIDRYEAEWRARTSRRGARAGAAAGMGPASVGRRAARTRWCRHTARNCGSAGSRSCTSSATSLRRQALSSPCRGRAPWTATASSSWRSTGWAHVARRGTRPTPAVRSSGSSRPAEAWSSRAPCAVSWQRTDRSRHRRLTPAARRDRRARARAFAHVASTCWPSSANRRPHRRLVPKRETITVVEGAAGAGKTARLAATRERAIAAGRRMVVVTPTLKAAQVAEGEIGAAAYSAAWLLHQHGFRWDEDGRWSRVDAVPDVSARLRQPTCSSSTRRACSTRTLPARYSGSPTSQGAP